MSACYRHPDRETGVSCSRCDRPICPDCMTPSPVGMRCPECAGERSDLRRPRVTGRAAAAPATYALIALNVVGFLVEIAGGAGALSAQGGGSAIGDAGLYGPAIADGGEWWRIVTAGFLHAGPLHLMMNMFVLYVLGTLLEPAIGSPRFVGVYVVSLLAGSFGALIATPDAVTVGASGAVYGLMGATIVMARRRGIEQVASQVGLWLVLNLVFTLSVPGISLGGHLGGLAGGVASGLALAVAERAGDRGIGAGAGLAALAALAVVGALAAAS